MSAIVLFCLFFAAEGDRHAPQERLTAWMQQWRGGRIQELQGQIDAAQKKIVAERRLKGSAQTVQQLIRDVDQLQARVKAIRGGKPELQDVPRMDVQELRVGSTGLLENRTPEKLKPKPKAKPGKHPKPAPPPPPYPIQAPVKTIAGADEMLVMAGERPVWIKGLDTAGLRAGLTVRLGQVFEVTGKKAIDGGGTAFVLESLGSLE